MQLTIRDLSKTYPNGVQALRQLSLSVSPGMFGLLGPNGAGKSSLMRTIATLQEPDSGSIRLGDLDALRQKDEVRKVLGYLPQDFGVYPRVSAEALLAHFAVLKGIMVPGERREVVAALLHRTNLYDVRRKHLGTFSGGMKQRFGIAQALLGNPRLVIVDEPTAGLDPAERNRFYDLLSEIGENIVVILSTHIVEDVTNVCRRMAIICGGRVLQEGEPAEAIGRLQGKVWQKFVPRAQLQDYRRDHQVISTRLVGGRTLVHVLAASAPDASFAPVEVDLEDVYFSALGAAEPPAA